MKNVFASIKLSSATSRVEGFKFCQILNPHEMPLLSVLEGADLSILSRSMYLAIVCPTRTRDQRFWCKTADESKSKSDSEIVLNSVKQEPYIHILIAGMEWKIDFDPWEHWWVRSFMIKLSNRLKTIQHAYCSRLAAVDWICQTLDIRKSEIIIGKTFYWADLIPSVHW